MLTQQTGGILRWPIHIGFRNVSMGTVLLIHFTMDNWRQVRNGTAPIV